MTTAYAKGYATELKVKAYLKSLGYSVFRVGGSHGPADLIVICAQPRTTNTEVWLIQCQRGKYFSKDKKRELQDLADEVNANSTLAWATDARKRGNLGVKFSDDDIVNFAPKPLGAVEVGE